MDKKNINDALQELDALDAPLKNRSMLDSLIDHAEIDITGSRNRRLTWLIATTIATAKLQQVIDEDGRALFLLKGGTMLQHRLGLETRASKDLDGLVRDDIDSFIAKLDETLAEDWGTIGFERSEVEVINVPSKRIKPRRFTLILKINGKTWRNVPIEISPDEGMAGKHLEEFPAPNLAPFGIPTPDKLASLSFAYQIAQKVHAATGFHEPPDYINNRASDVVDLLLLKDLQDRTGEPKSNKILEAIEDIFTVRLEEATSLNRKAQVWPCSIQALSHWEADYASAAKECDIELSLPEAVDAVNVWLASL